MRETLVHWGFHFHANAVCLQLTSFCRKTTRFSYVPKTIQHVVAVGSGSTIRATRPETHKAED
jgi:hypothetical protein